MMFQNRQSSLSPSDNWVTATRAIRYLRDGLAPFVDEVVNQQYNQLIEVIGTKRCRHCSLANLLPDHAQNRLMPKTVCPFRQKNCLCLKKRSKLRRKCPNGVCGRIYDGILRFHHSKPPTPLWENADISQWSEDPWECAKCFISLSGYMERKGPQDIDCIGLLHIIINNTGMHRFLQHRVTGNDIYCRVLSHIEGIHRNPNHEIDNEALRLLLQDIKAVLHDRKMLHERKECNEAARNIDQLACADEESSDIDVSFDEDFEDYEENSFISRYETDFTHEAKIGKGAYGVVFRATKKMENYPYAVKRISLRRMDPNGQVKGEVQALVKLDHPNIVRYFSSWIENPPEGWQEKWDEDNELSEMSTSASTSTDSSGIGMGTERRKRSYLYIQMQLCKTTLRIWLDENFQRDRNYVLKLFQQIAGAIRYVHDKRLVHRDLNPSNIFFSDEDIIKVGDFGLATALSENEEVLFYNEGGTYLYRSPEVVQARGKVVSDKVDIFSMGVILFELLQAFETKMERAKVLKDLQNHEFPADFSTKMPREKTLVVRLLARKSAERPTAADIFQLLSDLQAD